LQHVDQNSLQGRNIQQERQTSMRGQTVRGKSQLAIHKPECPWERSTPNGG